jgi:Flp pilus assembly secretin CpaC
LHGQVLVRDRLADAADLAEHGLLVGGQDLLRVLRDAKRVDHRDGRRQRHLEANPVGDVASAARIQKILVGGPSLARIAQLTEVQIVWADAVRQAERHQRDAGLVSGRHDLQVGVGAEQGDLPADPQAPSARFAVRDALEVWPEQLARRRKHVLSRVQRDAPHEVHVRRHAMTSLLERW